MAASPRRVAWARVPAGMALALLGLLVLLNGARYRDIEAWSAARLVAATVDRGTQVVPNTATFIVGLGTEHPVGLRIDQLCSTGAFVGIAFIITGLLIALAGASLRRGLLGLGALAGLLLLVNVLRLALLSWTASTWGLTGWFEWVHLYGGAGLSMIAIAVGCGLYLRLIRRSVTRPGPSP